jgi:molecular chaperone DnaK
MDKAIGIDLGTTNCAVAHIDANGRAVILPNADGEAITPSVICIRQGETLIGTEAKVLQRLGESNIAAFFKRQMGDSSFLLDLAGSVYTATDLSAMLLRRLKQDAAAALGMPVSAAVITVPAYFRQPEREATLQAGRDAGLEVLQVVNEPTAAAIAYGIRAQGPERTILVYDLGGGTFDVTLLRLAEDEIRVLTSDGDRELGGKDWDLRLLDWLDSRFLDDHGIRPTDLAGGAGDLLVLAEEAKRRLTDTEATFVSIAQGGSRARYRLDRALFAELTADLLERTISLTSKVLDSQGLSAANLDGVLLVGGSTRMPMVQAFVRERLGHEPTKGVDVDQSVALGAAIVAAEQQDRRCGQAARPRFGLPAPVRMIDVTNHSLGMIALNADRSAYLNAIILPKDSAIPNAQTRPFQHRVRSGHADLEVYVTQGESDSPADVAYLGKYLIKQIPATPAGVTVLEIEYRYDHSGTVAVAAQVQATGQALTVCVEALPADVPARFLGAPQLAEVPVQTTVYLVIDCSGSMDGTPLQQAKQAAHGFVEHLDLSHCAVGLIAFHDATTVLLAACANAKKIRSAINGLSIGGGTSANPFEEVRKRLSGVEGARFAVVLTDGQWAGQGAAVRTAKACHVLEIGVVAIGFGSADEHFLKQIASTDEAGLLTDLSRLEETFATVAQVLTRAGGLSPVPGSGTSGGPVGGGAGTLLGLFTRRR